MTRILLTDGQQRKTLAAARSLGRRGVEVMTAEVTPVALSRFSRYSHRGLVYPDPAKNPGDFCDWLAETITEHRLGMVFPMDDHTLGAIIANRERFEKLCRIPLPPSAAYYIAADKGQAAKAARSAGLKCPQTLVPADLQEIYIAFPEMKFPVIIKPRRSSGSRGITVIQNKAGFWPAYQKIHARYPLPIVQEYITPGDKYDVCLLFDQAGRLKASFAQRELRCFPLEKGPSTVQESVVRPDLVDQAVRLLASLNWTGLAEVEFMLDGTTGQPVFLEINPRFWGSLQMAVLAGVDFPWLFYRMVRGEEIEDVFSYQIGLKCRWLWPSDILHFLANPDRLSMDPPFFSTKKTGVYDDTFSTDDPLPLLGFFLACLRYVFDREMWRMMFFR